VTLNTPMTSEPDFRNEVSQAVSDGALTTEAIRAMRRSYGEIGLLESDLHPDPIAQFTTWLGEAAENIVIVEANAMVLSTVEENTPVSRTVLLKEVSGAGFTFFTNYESAKARQIAVNPQISLLFPWYPMERQVMVRGVAEKVSQSDSHDYFASRPWGSQIGAWASSQSQNLASREVLEESYAHFANLYPEGLDVPTPPHWGGYLVRPTVIEFWQGRYSRLHDRLRYTLTEGGWQLGRLHP